MSKFECPMMSRGEIVAILGESQIANISEHDLSNPTPDFLSDLYTRLLFHIDALHEYLYHYFSILSFFTPNQNPNFWELMCREEHGQLEFAALEHLENPEFHSDSTRIVKLYNRVKQVMASLDCPKSFTLKDLIKPDSARTELFLSAILNFSLYRLGFGLLRLSIVGEMICECEWKCRFID